MDIPKIIVVSRLALSETAAGPMDERFAFHRQDWRAASWLWELRR